MFNEDLSFFIICSYDSKETSISANDFASPCTFFALRLLLTEKGDYITRSKIKEQLYMSHRKALLIHNGNAGNKI